MSDNKYCQLVADMNSGVIPLTIVISAIRQHYRDSPNIPEDIKGLICGSGESDAGYVFRHMQVMRDVIGKMELAYRRGADFNDQD